MITQFGSGTGVFYEEGNLFRASGAPYYTQIGTAQDIVLAAYTLPANSFDGLAGTNRGLTITAQGNFAANGNNKTTKIIYNPSTAVQGSAVVGGVTLATTGVSAGNNVGWQLMANVFKYGAANSNTQMGNMAATVVGTTHGGIGLSQALTATENGPIIIAVTGNGVAASDVSLWFAEVNAMN
jgi:hypothetical protein